MIITGILSLIQILLLPGLIFNRMIKNKANSLYKLITIVTFSMLFNFILVLGLVLSHSYTFNFILFFSLAEILAILFMYRKSVSTSLGNYFSNRSSNFRQLLTHFFHDESKNDTTRKTIRIIKIIALIIATISLGWVFVEYISQLGTVFSRWDAVISYNRWATEWANGMFPTGATEYPQLLPANWSLTYVFTQSQVGIFAKMVQGVFPILFVLAFFDLGLTYGSAGFLFGVPLSMIILKKFAGISIFEGYMDVAVTTFTFLSFYMILKDYAQNKYSTKTLWLSGIVILAAAMTKQSGVLAFGAWCLINLFLLLSKNPGRFWKACKNLLLPTIAILVLIASWYIFKINRDVVLGEASSFAITNSWAIDDIKSGFLNVVLVRLTLLEFWVLLIPLLILSLFFAKRELRLLFLCYGVPYLLVSLSYGLVEGFVRYLTPITFIFALSACVILDLLLGSGLELINRIPLEKMTATKDKLRIQFTRVFHKLTKVSIWLVLVPIIAVLVLIGIKYPDSKIMRNYEYQQLGIGNRVINVYLEDFYKDKDPNDLTLSWYPFVNYLPGLKGRAVSVCCGTPQVLSDYLKQADIHYLLLYNTTPSDITDYAYSLVEKGQLVLITDFGLVKDGLLFEIKR